MGGKGCDIQSYNKPDFVGYRADHALIMYMHSENDRLLMQFISHV